MARTPSALVSLPEPVLDPENPTPKQLRAARRRTDIRIRAELGAALELAELDDVATLEHLEKRLAVVGRLDAKIAALYKELAFVRAIKSIAPPPRLPLVRDAGYLGPRLKKRCDKIK
jgi:hypothetical protein